MGETRDAEHALRVLWMPAFHPPACVTAFTQDRALVVTVRGEWPDGERWSARGLHRHPRALKRPLDELVKLPEQITDHDGYDWHDGCPTHVWARWSEGHWEGGGELAASPRVMFAVSAIVPILAHVFPEDARVRQSLADLEPYLR